MLEGTIIIPFKIKRGHFLRAAKNIETESFWVLLTPL